MFWGGHKAHVDENFPLEYGALLLRHKGTVLYHCEGS